MTPPFVRANTMLALPDGTRLATLVVRPQIASPAPAVLLRTPYGKDRHLEEGLGWARHGFAFVAQDVRGRYDSDGVWEPYAAEHADGAATIAWLAEQPWCNGQVVVAGGSYAGFAAWAAALSGHPAVCAAIVLVPAMGSHHTLFDPAGILNLADHTWWWMTYADGRAERPRLFETMYRTQPDVLSHLPVVDLAERLWADLPGWRARIEHGPDASPPYAIRDDVLAQLRIPAMHIGGWHDPFVSHTLHQWQIVGSGVTPRPARALIIGPWTHTLDFNGATTIGARDFGPQSRLPLGRLQVEWLTRVLQAAPPNDVRVRFFVMGRNEWRHTDAWPQPTRPMAWYAASDGRLVEAVPDCAGCDSFQSDPLDPFPARSLPVEQQDLNDRADAARYLTPPLDVPLTWAGAPQITLYAATDAPGADWVVRLHEIDTAGRQIYLTHGLVDAARARGGAPLEPHAFARYNIALKPLAISIPAGHRLCLEVASSAFPEYARNLQTGADRYTTAETRVARQQIGYGTALPTCLLLPVLPEDGAPYA